LVYKGAGKVPPAPFRFVIGTDTELTVFVVVALWVAVVLVVVEPEQADRVASVRRSATGTRYHFLEFNPLSPYYDVRFSVYF
jgi:hypothetical protein